jgi:DHA2 family multidrug resistance protein
VRGQGLGALMSMEAALTALPEESATATGGREHVSIIDWIIILTACLGAFMAVLDIQITNSSLADIQGALGATIDEGSWISTSYLIAEIIVIPLSAYLARAFGFKHYLLGNTALFILASCLCALARDLPSMISFRALQGFAGGVLIPLAMQIILQKLPKSQQSIGLSLFGVSATFAPAIGPSLGGWITDNYGWPNIFYLNVLPGLLMILVLGYFLESSKAEYSLLKNGDWAGIITMAVGLGCLEAVLEEGNRKDWFGSDVIVRLAILSVVALSICLIIELKAREPVVDLRLFLKRNFFFSGIINLAVGAGLYGPQYSFSLYLSQIQGYNALQIGEVMMWFGIPQLFVIVLVPWLSKTVDGRIMIFVGLLLFISGFAMNACIDYDVAGPQLVLPLVVRALGLPLIFVPLSAIAVEGVQHHRVASASALYNMIRNLGGSFAIAGISTLLTNREKFHSQIIGDTVSIYSPVVRERLDALMNGFLAKGSDISIAQQQAVAVIDNTIRREANLLAFGDSFFIFALIMACGCVAVLFLKKASGDAAPGMH